MPSRSSRSRRGRAGDDDAGGLGAGRRRWAALKPAHAWLNVFGFLSVVIAATLVHLAPTVAGTRIRVRRSATVAIVALSTGSALVAIGFAGGLEVVGRAGAVIELVGAGALLAHAVGVRRDRGRWTSDPGWHRVTGLSLLAAPCWFLVAVAIAAGRVLWLGPVPGAWSMELLAVPLILGWTAQVLIGSWTHLVPAIGPGDQAMHRRPAPATGSLGDSPRGGRGTSASPSRRSGAHRIHAGGRRSAPRPWPSISSSRWGCWSGPSRGPGSPGIIPGGLAELRLCLNCGSVRAWATPPRSSPHSSAPATA